MAQNPVKSNKAGLFIKKACLLALSIVLLLSALGTMLSSIAGGLLVAAGAVALMPFLFVHVPMKYKAVLALVLVVAGTSIAGEAGRKERVAKREENIRLAKEATQERQQQALASFRADPEKTLREISAQIDAKNYGVAKDQLTPLLASEDQKVKALYDKVSDLLEKEAEAQRIADEQKQKEAEAAQQATNWDVSREASEMDDTPGISVMRSANAPVSAWLHQVTPSLMIRCKENKTDVLLIAETNFTPVLGEYGKAEIRVRIDDKKAVPQLWSESTDGEAAFAPDPVNLLRQLQNASTLRIEFNPFNSGLAVAEFDTRGVKPHLVEVAKVCGWRL